MRITVGEGAVTRVRSTTRAPPPPARAAAAAASAAACKPFSERSAVWAKPVVSPPTTPTPAPPPRPHVSSSTLPSSRRAPGAPPAPPPAAPPPAPRGELLDLAVVEAGAGPPPVLHEHLREVAPSSERGPQRSLHHCLLDHLRHSPHWNGRAYLRTVTFNARCHRT